MEIRGRVRGRRGGGKKKNGERNKKRSAPLQSCSTSVTVATTYRVNIISQLCLVSQLKRLKVFLLSKTGD
jgi:hypothetical protein